MYELHYGMKVKPFQLSPDPKFFFASEKHRQALSYLEYGLEQREGFIVITGPIGTGKTMLAQSLLTSIELSEIEAIQIVTSNLSPLDLLSLIATEFKLPVNSQSKSVLIEVIHQHLLSLFSQGKYALILVDEAQNLPIETIEELRMLSNFQKNNKPLLQSFLLGQAELKDQLQSPSMEQFRQRIIASFHLQPLNEMEVKEYIEHRLKQAGLAKPRIFTDECYALICKYTLGVPRKVNLLIDRVLLYGFLNELTSFKVEHIEIVVEEMSVELGFSSMREAQEPPKADKHINSSHLENISELTSNLLSEDNKLIKTLSDLDAYLQENIDQKVKVNRYLDKVIKQKKMQMTNIQDEI